MVEHHSVKPGILTIIELELATIDLDRTSAWLVINIKYISLIRIEHSKERGFIKLNHTGIESAAIRNRPILRFKLIFQPEPFAQLSIPKPRNNRIESEPTAIDFNSFADRQHNGVSERSHFAWLKYLPECQSFSWLDIALVCLQSAAVEPYIFNFTAPSIVNFRISILIPQLGVVESKPAVIQCAVVDPINLKPADAAYIKSWGGVFQCCFEYRCIDALDFSQYLQSFAHANHLLQQRYCDYSPRHSLLHYW
ncbi:hypothetical protein PRZ48_011012 [Zasmidium cellare]|uniref:Uncharacterized protein n=1 Tax=Zasmidium cellare TaxID=395010 RepID=A0ABR0EA84_ZASCE|nr:hypothetical protein PRZ48_011012 [Zasmidium cellare]